jgi:hypothetical protein
MRVTNAIPLGYSLFLPIGTANCFQTLKAQLHFEGRTIQAWTIRVLPYDHPSNQSTHAPSDTKGPKGTATAAAGTSSGGVGEEISRTRSLTAADGAAAACSTRAPPRKPPVLALAAGTDPPLGHRLFPPSFRPKERAAAIHRHCTVLGITPPVDPEDQPAEREAVDAIKARYRTQPRREIRSQGFALHSARPTYPCCATSSVWWIAQCSSHIPLLCDVISVVDCTVLVPHTPLYLSRVHSRR